MKKVYLVLTVLFSLLTVAGAVYALLHRGTATGGYACIPVLCTLLFLSLYGKDKAK